MRTPLLEGKDLPTFKYTSPMSGMSSAATLDLEPATNLPEWTEATPEVLGESSNTVVTCEHHPLDHDQPSGAMVLRLWLATGLSLALCAPVLADCADDIRDIMARSVTSGPFRVESTVTTSAGDMVMHAKMVPPGAMHTILETGGQTMEMIAVDGGSYMNLAGSWTALPPGSERAFTRIFSGEAMGSFKDMRDAQCLGSTTIDGNDYLAFSFGFRRGEDESRARLLLDPLSNLPARMETSVDLKSITATGISVYTYDPTIIIIAPEL